MKTPSRSLIVKMLKKDLAYFNEALTLEKSIVPKKQSRIEEMEIDILKLERDLFKLELEIANEKIKRLKG